MVDIFQKMKNLFSGNKNSEPSLEQKNKLLNIISSTGISEKNLEKIIQYGKEESDIKKALKEIFFFKEVEINNLFAENIEVYQAFQIAKILGFKNILFTYNPSFNVDSFYFKTKIHCRIEEKIPENFYGLIVCRKNEQNISGKKVSLEQNDADFQFPNISNKNFGQKINEAIENKEKIIGFSSSTSVLDAHLFSVDQLIYNGCEKKSQKISAKINEMDLVQKFQNTNAGTSVNFDEIFFSLEKVEELAGTNMLASFGVKITPEMKTTLSKQKAIINSMTEKERKNPSIIDHMRIQRIAKGSGSSVEEVSKLVSMIDMIKQHGGKFAANLMNPSTMFNMNNKN